MLDGKVVALANDRIRVEIDEQVVQLHKDIDKLKAESVGKGTLGSGSALQRIASLCADTVKNRAQLVWQALFRFITTAGVRYTVELSQELKDIVSMHMPEKITAIESILQKNAMALPLSSAHLLPQLKQEIDRVRLSALTKLYGEIDLFGLSLRNRETPAETSVPDIFNIYSPVGAIQTGTAAVAYVTQSIDSEARRCLTNALDAIAQALSATDSLPLYPKEEIVELVEEGKFELQKDRPNVTKLRSLLITVGAAVQTVASSKPAYELLKQGLLYLGMKLP